MSAMQCIQSTHVASMLIYKCIFFVCVCVCVFNGGKFFYRIDTPSSAIINLKNSLTSMWNNCSCTALPIPIQQEVSNSEMF